MNTLPPKPANTVFGIIVDGKRTSIGLPSVKDAEDAARGLAEEGRSVAIFDRVTGKIVKRL